MYTFKNYITTITPLSDGSWELLQGCAEEVVFKKKQYLLREGEMCHAVWFIAKGFCKVFYNQDGREVNTAFYFENDFATNAASLISSSKSGYYIQACEELHVVKLDKDKLLAAYAQSHEIESFGRKILALINAKQEAHADGFKRYTPAQRFQNLVEQHPDFLQRVSLVQAASYLGISRETLSRLRAKR